MQKLSSGKQTIDILTQFKLPLYNDCNVTTGRQQDENLITVPSAYMHSYSRFGSGESRSSTAQRGISIPSLSRIEYTLRRSCNSHISLSQQYCYYKGSTVKMDIDNYLGMQYGFYNTYSYRVSHALRLKPVILNWQQPLEHSSPLLEPFTLCFIPRFSTHPLAYGTLRCECSGPVGHDLRLQVCFAHDGLWCGRP